MRSSTFLTLQSLSLPGVPTRIRSSLLARCRNENSYSKRTRLIMEDRPVVAIGDIYTASTFPASEVAQQCH